MSELEADRYAHEHAETSLVGYERAEGARALALVLLAGNAVDLGVVGLSEPASFGKRFGKHALKRWGGVRHNVLCMGKTTRLNQARKRRVHLGCCVGTVGQSHPIIGSREEPGDAPRPVLMRI